MTYTCQSAPMTKGVKI